MSRALDVGPGLTALTDLVPLDGRLSWVPPDLRGFEPHTKFLITNGDRILLLDTGVAAHEQSLLESLAPHVDGRKLTILVTRNELDCLGNLGALADRYPDAQVLSTNALPVIGLVHLKSARREQIAVDRVRHGETLAAYGFANLRIIAPAIRLLGTGWVVDDRSKTLFPSDFFAADLLDREGDDVLRRDMRDFPAPERLRAIIASKFDWIARADRPLVMDRWRTVFSALRLDAIAPSHGRMTQGAACVDAVIEAYRQAVETLLRKPASEAEARKEEAV
jgi:flavorubredoxin